MRRNPGFADIYAGMRRDLPDCARGFGEPVRILGLPESSGCGDAQSGL